MTLAAIAPTHNAVVHAAAGTGKTWLLVSRIVRLLLAGAEPSSILSITFTRKAAAEMRLRVGDRLIAMCEASDAQLCGMLEQIGAVPDAPTLARARGLYEALLVAPHPLRTTTFHAFCQELLTRFAFEAGIPPSFEIIEQTAEIEAAAMRALDRDLSHGDKELAQAMERLLRALGGLANTRIALREFIAHRGDWWPYTENEADPVAYAAGRLQAMLHIDPAADPVAGFAQDREVRGLVQSLVTGLGQDTPASLRESHECLHAALAAESSDGFLRLVTQALYTQDGKKPRSFRIPNGLAKTLGSATVERLTRERDALLDCLQQTTEHCKRHATWQRSRDWCVVGTRLLHHFQEAKRAEGVLDFADLEWFAYRMLSQSRHAEWVQYKLDQRIDHLLVDEFQDTNPTQWRLLQPLLEEMAAGSGERRRSVFLVGDEKQSIYRFRRADPALFTRARDWLAAHTRAGVYDQHISWRSSPAVVRFVNLVFDQPQSTSAGHGDYTLNDFRTHDTHRAELWGHAELLPLVLREAREAPAPAFRNPLQQPRVSEEDKRREREGELIADKIHALLGQPVHGTNGVRALNYGDVMILLRNRTYAGVYEAALRKAGIPYVGAGRGTFLECLEVRDIVALLRLLISPWEDVALAAVLRSPIFGASDADLLLLANTGGSTWYERLAQIGAAAAVPAPPADDAQMSLFPVSVPAGAATRPALARAAVLLAAWRRMADRVPVHDLLDRVYFEANVPARYESAAPTHLRQRIAANLTRLLDLALDTDGGRFPSLARFLARLEVLTAEDNESVETATPGAGNQVRIMTIHAAKGLESPVVFLADTARDTNDGERGADALIEWPIEQSRPSHFLLLGRKSDVDRRTADIVARRSQAAFQEESNLLYVALTRAKQLLFVSGCEAGRRKEDIPSRAGDVRRGWYGYIERRFEAVRQTGDTVAYELQLRTIRADGATEPVNLCGFVTHGLPPPLVIAPTAEPQRVSVDAHLTVPFAPVATDDNHESEESVLPPGVDVALLSAAKQRGIVIHRALERLTTEGTPRERARRQLWREFAGHMNHAHLTEYWNEACAVIDTPGLRRFFDARSYLRAQNEVTVIYRDDRRDVTGIIDRLIHHDDRLVLIDYKTHPAPVEDLPLLIERHKPQLRLYAEGLRRLWPGRPLETVLLFTHSKVSIPVDV